MHTRTNGSNLGHFESIQFLIIHQYTTKCNLLSLFIVSCRVQHFQFFVVVFLCLCDSVCMCNRYLCNKQRGTSASVAVSSTNRGKIQPVFHCAQVLSILKWTNTASARNQNGQADWNVLRFESRFTEFKTFKTIGNWTDDFHIKIFKT